MNNHKESNPMLAAHRRAQKRNASKDGGGKQLKRRGVFATVTDYERGRIKVKGQEDFPQSAVPIPATKREKYSGPPR